MWYCCDLQNLINKEHIKRFGTVGARCSKFFFFFWGGGVEVDGYTSRHALPFFKRLKWIAYLAFVTHSCIQKIIQW